MTRQHAFSPVPKAAGAIVALAVLGVAGCTASSASSVAASGVQPVQRGVPATRPAAAAGLDAFRGCADALAGLRHATAASVTAYGLPDGTGGRSFYAQGAAMAASGAAGPVTAPAAASAASSAAVTPAYSGTNTAVAGVDEPDMVKTDGRRIVTLSGGELTVVDAATRQVTGRLRLPGGTGSVPYPETPAAGAGVAMLPGYGPGNLLLSGDHALVLSGGYGPVDSRGVSVFETRLYLVDLSGPGDPRVLSSYGISGDYLDARMVGSVVRVITRTAPRVIFPAMPAQASQDTMLVANRAAVTQAGLGAWLPSYTTTGGGRTVTSTVACDSVSHPVTYSGTDMLTVATFDLSAPVLGTGEPVSIEADGDTVYGTASSLYIASGNQWSFTPAGGSGGSVSSSGQPVTRQQTQVYRFSLPGSGAPVFAGSGTVPGYLVDQYALSEWDGYLRVATTTGLSWAVADGPSPAGTSAPPSESAVYELSLAGSSMPVVGEVTGLGAGERIYSVRFVGPVGYVVTFRQTDPLYTVDLSVPTRPRVVGSLALTGFSAYLHPVSATELIGVGQSADAMGHIGGMQVSLFSVANLAAPARLATYALAGFSSSLAEFDPHAFLYWPASSLVVIPLSTADSGDLVLRLSGSSLVRVGLLQPPGAAQGYPVERSLVVGQTLWTISADGLQASDLTTLHQEAWLPISIA